jgi:hypothetical protein
MTSIVRKIRSALDRPCEDPMGTKDCSDCGKSRQGRKERCIATCTKTSRPCRRRQISDTVPFCLQHMVSTVRRPQSQSVWVNMSPSTRTKILGWAIWYMHWERKKSRAIDAYIRIFSEALVDNPLYPRLAQSVGTDVALEVAAFVPRNFSSLRPNEFLDVVHLHLDKSLIESHIAINRQHSSRDGVDLSKFTNVRQITMSDRFDERLSSFPAGLQSLEVGSWYKYPMDTLPSTMMRLDLWRAPKELGLPSRLPSGLTHFVAPQKYPMALNNNTLPSTLTHLTLGDRPEGHRLTMTNLPPYLMHLDLSADDPLGRATPRVGLLRTIRPNAHVGYNSDDDDGLFR